jgi:hypothetical protein
MSKELDLDDCAAQSELAVKELAELRAENKRLRESLEEIAKKHYGIEIGDDDETVMKYWAARALMMRNKARAALDGGANEYTL